MWWPEETLPQGWSAPKRSAVRSGPSAPTAGSAVSGPCQGRGLVGRALGTRPILKRLVCFSGSLPPAGMQAPVPFTSECTVENHGGVAGLTRHFKFMTYALFLCFAHARHWGWHTSLFLVQPQNPSQPNTQDSHQESFSVDISDEF